MAEGTGCAGKLTFAVSKGHFPGQARSPHVLRTPELTDHDDRKSIKRIYGASPAVPFAAAFSNDWEMAFNSSMEVYLLSSEYVIPSRD